jgi:hypothetical protein
VRLHAGASLLLHVEALGNHVVRPAFTTTPGNHDVLPIVIVIGSTPH